MSCPAPDGNGSTDPAAVGTDSAGVGEAAERLDRAPLDPQIKALNDAVPGGLGLPMGEPEEAREAFHALNVGVAESQPPASLASTEDLELPGADGPLPARLYRPRADGPVATLVYLHGGGFVVGDIEAYDLQARTLAEKAGVALLSVEYRLAPENPFPAGLDDAIAAARWALAEAESLGGDPARVAIGGDSAGGNLAAAAAQALRGESPGLAAQVLIYPVLDFAEARPSHAENANGPLLTKDRMDWCDGHYLSDETDRRDPRLSPLQAGDFAGLPPAIVVTAGYDPLRDEGDAYAEALAAAGVPVRHLRYDSLIHGFFGLGPFSDGCTRAIDEICAATGELLAAPAE
ncbi:MAG: alpha/beta hydrolase [Actinobacteria bacterium]|nr:alpha/beta hydrolase [Actinomycetota bacterium]